MVRCPLHFKPVWETEGRSWLHDLSDQRCQHRGDIASFLQARYYSGRSSKAFLELCTSFLTWPGELAQMVERLLRKGRGPIFELSHAREKDGKDAENGRTR